MTDPVPINISRIEQREAKQQAQQLLADQVESKDRFMEEAERGFNPGAVEREQGRLNRFRPLNSRRKAPTEGTQKVTKVGKKREDDLANSYNKRNSELPASTLRSLRNALQNAENPDEVLDHVLDAFEDPTLADEALEYLEKSLEGNAKEHVASARNYLNSIKKREIDAGRNIDPAAKSFHQKGVGANATELRNLYRDVTGNPRNHNVLFSELSEEYPFEQLKLVVAFLLKSLGYDLKSKGPSIAQAELIRLMTETRNLQSILWVYLFFKARMKLIKSLYEQYEEEEEEPPEFEEIAKEFIELVKERYPSVAKLLKKTENMGLTEAGKIIILMQYRDAIRELAPRIYNSLKHRQDLLMLIIEALEELEEEEEEDESI